MYICIYTRENALYDNVSDAILVPVRHRIVAILCTGYALIDILSVILCKLYIKHMWYDNVLPVHCDIPCTMNGHTCL